MALAHQRAARLERTAAKTLGTKRVTHRPRYQPAPDVEAIELPSGERLQAEAKSRKRLPRLIVDALAQAQRYARGAAPLAVLRQHGGKAIGCMWLDDLARLLGVAIEPHARKVKRDPRQVELFGGES